MSKWKVPEVPVPVLTKYWVNEQGMLTLSEDENVLVTQVNTNIALHKADEVEQYIAYHYPALPPAMTWTRERPSKPGWYWYRTHRGVRLAHVHDGARSKRGNLYAHVVVYDPTLDNSGEGQHLRNMHGEWAGPLEPPQ